MWLRIRGRNEFVELMSEEAMFATAVLWARKLGPKPVKLANLGDQVQVASATLYKIIEQHGPITLSDCWNHASQVPGRGFHFGN